MKKLISTSNLDRAEWLRYRKKGIGGSDAGAVCGLNDYVSPIAVYRDKTTDDVSDYDNEAMRQGRELEEYVARRFSEKTGLKVHRANAIYYDPERPFMLADPDRIVTGTNMKVGLECKTVSPYSISKWEEGRIPPQYLAQVYHYMSVFNADSWYIAAIIFGKDFIIRKVERDDNVIHDLRNIEENFWKNHVQVGIMPAPDGSEASDKLIASIYSQADPGNRIALSGFRDKLIRHQELVEVMDRMDTEKKQIEQELKMYLGAAEEADGEGFRVSWKNVSSRRFDSTRLKNDDPETYLKYTKETSSRRLTIKAA